MITNQTMLSFSLIRPIVGAAERVVLGPKGSIDKIKVPQHARGDNSYEQLIAKLEATDPAAAELARRAADRRIFEEIQGQRRSIGKVLRRWAFVSTVGAIIIGGPCVVITAAQKPTVSAAEVALENQIDDISLKFDIWKGEFEIKAKELKDLFWELIKQLKNTELWKEFGEKMLEGLKDDFLDIIRKGDFSPDKLKRSFEEVLKNNKGLGKTVSKIEGKAKEIKTHIEDFDDDLELDAEKRKEKFLQDYSEEFQRGFKQELMKKLPWNSEKKEDDEE